MIIFFKKIFRVCKVFLPTMGKASIMILIYYKMSNFFLKRNLIFFKNFCVYRMYKNYHVLIAPDAILPWNICLPHPLGIVIGGGVKIGNNVTIYQNVTIGRKKIDVAEYPIIEDNCVICANSVVIGKIIVRKNTVIGANSTLFSDTEENSLYAGTPAKRIG